MDINLDKIDLAKADPRKMRDFLADFPKYAQDAWQIADEFALPTYFIKCKKIVFLGMGASGIAGEFLKDLMGESPAIIECVHNYNLPAWVDKQTLVIALSHSGETEEALYAFVSAFQMGAKLLAITSGGRLERLCYKYRAAIIKYQFSSEPKLAFPYLFVIPLVVLLKLGLIEFSEDEFAKTMILLSSQIKKISPDNHTAINPAKDLAKKIAGRLVYIISSDNLRASGLRFANAISENGKNLAAIGFLPEINHNLIAGLEFPNEIIDKTTFIILESKYSREEIKKRQNITSYFFSRKKISCVRLNFPSAINKFSEQMLSVNFSEYVAMYLGFLNQVNPSSATVVEQIKSELSK